MRRALSLAITLIATVAAASPVALSRLSGGVWELSGLPGTHGPVRQCITDIMILAQFEHRGRHCTRTVVDDSASSTVVDYDCGAAGFGHSEIDVLTPRSLRISTQGISDQLPFGYTIQAHRVGECASADNSRH